MGKIEIPLDIEGVRVIKAEINEKREIIIKVENIDSSFAYFDFEKGKAQYSLG